MQDSGKRTAGVKALLDGERQAARRALARFLPSYPLAVTRDLPSAKAWIRGHARGSERYGPGRVFESSAAEAGCRSGGVFGFHCSVFSEEAIFFLKTENLPRYLCNAYRVLLTRRGREW
jgi:hypothetical protein